MLQKLFLRTKISKKTTIIIYKVAVLISAFSMFYLLYQMIQVGIMGITPGEMFTSSLSHHAAVKCLGWATFLHIILIKLGVFMKGGAKHDKLFFIHLAFAILFTFLVILMVTSYKQVALYYTPLTILTTLSYSVVAFIGIPMLFKRF